MNTINKEDNNILDVSKNVKWIGILDYDIVTFDVVMETKYGTTYNSYFIDADKKAIIETSKESFWKTYQKKIKQVVDPNEIEYIIINHTEPDHTGNLRNLLNIAPNAQVVASGNAIRYLKDLIGPDFPHMVVREGDTLDLGNKTLRFIGAANLHWPDSMYTYLEEERILFTCDSFGAHFCKPLMFDDLVGDFDDAFKYYFDVILSPFSKFMIKAIDKIKPLDIAVICPGHGPILRSKWRKYVEMSEKFASEKMKFPKKLRVFIPYVSAYQKTAILAEKISEGLKESGEIEVKLADIEMMSIGDIEENITKSNALIVGSPTINQNILLPVYKLFALITPIRDRGKLAGGFGSYGWSGEGAKLIKESLQNLKLEYFKDGVFVKFTPTEDELKMCVEYGKAFAAKLKEKVLVSEN